MTIKAARAATKAALLACFFAGGVTVAGQPALSDDAVKTLALAWFANMQAGRIDRSQLAPEYSAQLTGAAVQDMAKYMKDHDYGAPPRSAEIVNERAIGGQKFYVVKLVFPRGDAASLLIGFDAVGKITGLNLMSMAGD